MCTSTTDCGAYACGSRGYGKRTGDFTCSRANVAAGVDPIKNPFACQEESQDVAYLSYFGGDADAALKLSFFEPYVTLGLDHLDVALQVHSGYADLVR